VRPETQQFSLSWKPEVRFLERRLEPLRALDERKEVRSFNTQQSDVVVSVGDHYHELRYGSGGLSMRLSDSKADPEPLFAAIADVIRIFEPETVGAARANLQYLHPLEGDYGELRRLWAERFVQPAFRPLISDWALLLNADFVGIDPAWAGAVELGIVADDEVAPRLNRSLGKLSGGDSLGEISDRIELPGIGFFADSTWSSGRVGHDAEGGLLQATKDAWATIEMKVSELVTGINNDFSGAVSK
jgi:hypothetical protein